MKELFYPKVQLREPERIWLSEVYLKFKNKQQCTYKSLRAELINKLPINYNPKDMDYRLVTNDCQITLLGILTIDPQTDILQRANEVINFIKELILKEPDLKDISIQNIEATTHIDSNDVSIIMNLISRYGRFWSGASGNNGVYSNFTIDRDEIFDQYLYFNSIEELITTYYKEEEDRQNRAKSIQPEIEKQTLVEHTINPIFRNRITEIDPKLCFVLMPFTKSWSNRIYLNYIRNNIEDLGLQCLRADNLKGQIIIEDIWTKINQAAFIVADVTERNPNVMYELGIVHTVGKPTILITQEIEEIPFDFKHLRHYKYQDNSDGKEEFKELIRSVIKNIYSENYSHLNLFDN